MEELPPNLEEWRDFLVKRMEEEEEMDANRDQQRDMDARASNELRWR
jgi:hypothetical protein